ncbi:MAG TPA: PilN domain-containing protein [Acidiferrobacterales bacterium]|jgi:Tfp pilus assembly protein PilN
MRQQVNLYHPIFRRQEKKFSARTMLQAGVAVLAGILLMYLYAWWQVGALQRQAAQVDRDLAAANQRLAAFSARVANQEVDPQRQREIDRLEQRIAALERIRAVAGRDLFHGAAGYSDYFIALARQRLPDLWLTGFTIEGAGEQLTLEGRSRVPERVPEYLQKLSGEKLLAGTEFEVFQMLRPLDDQRKQRLPYVEFVLKSGVPRGARP